MNKHFIQVTNGMVPVVVLLLFVVALVAGQARANLPHQVTAAAPTLSADTKIILNVQMLRKIESLPQIVDSLLTLPADIEAAIGTLPLPSTNDADGERPSAQ
jgi:hypothetical protein